MTEELNRFARIKSLLQDTQRIDSHTISLVVAECDMALTAAQPAQNEREAFEAFAQACPMGRYSVARRGEGYDSSHTQIMWDAWQARASLPAMLTAAQQGAEQAKGDL